MKGNLKGSRERVWLCSAPFTPGRSVKERPPRVACPRGPSAVPAIHPLHRTCGNRIVAGMTSTHDRLRATLAALMQVTGETQDDLARALRVSQATFSRKQGRRTRWTLDDCDKIAKHYGISIADLLGSPDTALNALERNRRGPDATRI